MLQQTFYSNNKTTKNSYSDKKRPNEQLWKLLDEIKVKKIEDRERQEEKANEENSKKFVKDVAKQLKESQLKNQSIFEAKELDRNEVLRHMRDYKDSVKKE